MKRKSQLQQCAREVVPAPRECIFKPKDRREGDVLPHLDEREPERDASFDDPGYV